MWESHFCGKEQKDDSEALSCERCDNKFCIACVDIESAEYIILAKRPDFHWYCAHCEPKVIKSMNIEKEIEQRCEAYIAKTEERMEKRENQMKDKTDKKTVEYMIKKGLEKYTKTMEEKQEKKIT